MNMPDKKYCLVLCELHNKKIHGFDSMSDPDIRGHYMVISKFHLDDINDMNEMAELYNDSYIDDASLQNHSIFRNYPDIISNPKYIQPHIAECIYLRGEECIAIIKTVWIRLIQRTWKRVFAERRRVWKMRANTSRLIHKEVNGSWPKECAYLPSLYGMLRIN